MNKDSDSMLNEASSAAAITQALNFMQYFKTLKKEGLSETWAFKTALSWQQEIIRAMPQMQNQNNIEMLTEILNKLKGGIDNEFFNDGSFRWRK